MFLDTALVGGWAHFHLLYRLILHKGGSGKCKRVTHLAPGHLNTGILLHEHHLAQGYRERGLLCLGYLAGGPGGRVGGKVAGWEGDRGGNLIF